MVVSFMRPDENPPCSPALSFERIIFFCATDWNSCIIVLVCNQSLLIHFCTFLYTHTTHRIRRTMPGREKHALKAKVEKLKKDYKRLRLELSSVNRVLGEMWESESVEWNPLPPYNPLAVISVKVTSAFFPPYQFRIRGTCRLHEMTKKYIRLSEGREEAAVAKDRCCKSGSTEVATQDQGRYGYSDYRLTPNEGPHVTSSFLLPNKTVGELGIRDGDVLVIERQFISESESENFSDSESN